MVAHAETLGQQWLAEFGDLLFVEVEGDKPAPLPTRSFKRTTSPWTSNPLASITFKASFRITSCPFRKPYARDRRVQAHLHLAPGHIHIAGAVLIEAREDGVGGRRRGQFFDFGAQRFDLRFGFLEGRDELFVLLIGLVELVAGLVQPTDFFFHRLNLDAKLFDLPDFVRRSDESLLFSLGQPLRNVLNGISEGPEPAWTALRIGHRTTWDKRQTPGEIAKSNS